MGTEARGVMAERFLAVKGFDRFQHYRDRNPPWIKLHGTLLTDLAFLELPEAAQAQLVKLWVLASQLGHPLPNNPKLLAGKIGTTGKFHLASIIAAGFLIPCNDIASEPLAESEQDARPSVRARNQSSELEAGDDEEIAAVGLDEPSLSALWIAIWSNRAVTERWGEQTNPYTQGASVEIADELTRKGVEWPVARDSIYRQCRDSKQERPPRAPNYFRRGIEEDWERETARRAASRATGDAVKPASQRAPNGQGRATLLLGQIRALIQESQQPGQALRRFIPRAQVADLGIDVLNAYESVGGAERVINATGEQMGFLLRDFTAALEATRGVA